MTDTQRATVVELSNRLAYDFVPFVEVLDIVTELAPAQRADLVDIVLGALEISITMGQAVIGELEPPGEFIEWDLSGKAALLKVKDVWLAKGSDGEPPDRNALLPGDVCWLAAPESLL